MRPVRAAAVVARAAKNPPTVADTKAKFMEAYDKPVNPMYSTVVNELLVQQHLWRYQKRYQYDPVFAVGVCSIFDQVLDDLSEAEQEALFGAYVNVRGPRPPTPRPRRARGARPPPRPPLPDRLPHHPSPAQALDEDPKKYKADAKKMEAWASALSSADGVSPDAAGDEGQKALAEVAARISSGDFYYTRFFAIGLFRLLELSGASTPDALKATVKAMGVDSSAVTRDLNQYKSVLSKLTTAKEMMKEFLEREKRKTAERQAEKAAKAEKEAAAPADEAKAASA